MRTRSGTSNLFKRNAIAYAFLLPWLVGFLVLTAYPMLYSLGLGFTNYDFTKPNSTEFIGLGNYQKMFGSVFGVSEFTASTGESMRVDPYYMKSLTVTLTYVFVSVPLKLIFALAVAMLLNQKLRGCRSTAWCTTSPRCSAARWPSRCCGESCSRKTA